MYMIHNFSYCYLHKFEYSGWPLSILNPTYGWYRADSVGWNSTANLLYDISGNNNHANTGGNISLIVESGNGATAKLGYLRGGTSSTVLWPKGSIPFDFTICSVTRCVEGGKMRRILAGTLLSNWFHGHVGSLPGSVGQIRGIAYYGVRKTPIVYLGLWTHWLVMCGKNGGSTPNNILVDGVASGSSAGGVSNSSLCINANPLSASDWAFRELMIWNSSLSDADMVVASTALLKSLNDQVLIMMFLLIW